MADLQARLAQLVNYSAQLIFVGCDEIAKQQKSMNDFLSLNADDVEVSFFSASQDQSCVDYRKTIARQLTHQQIGSFTRTLRELMTGQLTQSQHYIVCISRADLLPQDFVFELWQWVSTTKQSGRDEHLNIILFGQHEWSEKMQDWLPRQKNQTPVLLSSQQVDAVGFDVNALESLMAERRAFFSTSGAFTDNNVRSNFIQNKWFISGVLGVFLVVFVGLLGMQYPEHIARLFDSAPFEHEPDHDEIVYELTTSPPTAERQIKVDQFLVEDFTRSAAESVTIENTTQASDVSKPTSVTQHLLVSEWKTELPLSVPNDGTDFAVPDIVSVKQLDQERQRQRVNENTAEQSVSATTSDASVTERSDITDDFTISDEYLFDEALLLQLPNDQVVIQLYGMRDPVILNDFLNDNKLQQETWIYRTKRNGDEWYVVLHNDIFDSYSAALNRVDTLPDRLTAAQPFPKSVSQIRSEIVQLN